MKNTVIEINAVNFGSTGGIMQGIKEAAKNSDIKVVQAYPVSKSNLNNYKFEDIMFGNRVLRNLSAKLCKYTGLTGCFNVLNTLDFLRKVNKYGILAIHMHNLHSDYINIPILFNYIRRHKIPVIWTLHDCWTLTGHCTYFTMAKCDKWKNGCANCKCYRDYPSSCFDNSKFMWKLKKKWFSNVENMTIVTPSQWLADLVKQSYLKDYPVKVINNGIDLSVFKPTPSDFRAKHNISDNKFILLGVAFGWGKRKGLDVFIELANRLDSKKYQIVLVGTDDTVDKQLPDSIISIHRTQNQQELAEIYTAADLFVNPTREENYPTVNMESIACGTPVLTFRTGGSLEIPDDTCGFVVDCDDVDATEYEGVRICETYPFSESACIKRAKSFDKNERFMEYIDLYKKSNRGVIL